VRLEAEVTLLTTQLTVVDNGGADDSPASVTTRELLAEVDKLKQQLIETSVETDEIILGLRREVDRLQGELIGARAEAENSVDIIRGLQGEVGRLEGELTDCSLGALNSAAIILGLQGDVGRLKGELIETQVGFEHSAAVNLGLQSEVDTLQAELNKAGAALKRSVLLQEGRMFGDASNDAATLVHSGVDRASDLFKM